MHLIDGEAVVSRWWLVDEAIEQGKAKAGANTQEKKQRQNDTSAFSFPISFDPSLAPSTHFTILNETSFCYLLGEREG